MQFLNNTMACCTWKSCTRSVVYSRINRKHTISRSSWNRIDSMWKSSIYHRSWATRDTRVRHSSAAVRVAATRVSIFNLKEEEFDVRARAPWERIKKREYFVHMKHLLYNSPSQSCFQSGRINSRNSASDMSRHRRAFNRTEKLLVFWQLNTSYSARITRSTIKIHQIVQPVDIAQHSVE